ncbi:MAG: AI-2E family transporter [Verrucomicrobiota bacterium]|jgi:predicted PurR-regulated permease PerM
MPSSPQNKPRGTKRTTTASKGTPKTTRSAAKPESTEKAFHELHVWQFQAFRDLLVIATVLGIFFAGYALRAVTVPLLVALLLAYLFDPVIEMICERTQLHRPTAILSLLLSVGGTLIVVFGLALPLVIGNAGQLISDLRDGSMHARIERVEPWVPERFQQDFEAFLRQFPQSSERARPKGTPVTQDPTESDPTPKPNGEDEPLPETTPSSAETEEPLEATIERIVQEQLVLHNEALFAALPPPPADATDSEGGNLWGFAKQSVQAVAGLIAAIVRLALLAFLIPFYFFFFSLWYHDVIRFFQSLIPDANKERALHLIHEMDNVIAGFVRGRIVISFIMGILLAVGWLLCGIPYAVILGLTVGVLCAVPYLGGIGIPIAIILLALRQFDLPVDQRMAWWGVLLWPSLVFGVVQVVEGYFLTPTIAGRATNLDPVTILVAILAGGSVFGVYGMLLAIPTAACLKILFREVVMPRIRAWMEGRAPDPLPFGKN